MQTDAVLSMTLRRLTALEIEKVEQEGRELREKIQQLKDLLGSQDAIRQTVAAEAREIADSHGNPRRTEVRSKLSTFDRSILYIDACPEMQVASFLPS